MSRGSLTIAQCVSDRQRITVHFDRMPTGPAAQTAAEPRHNRTGK